MRKSVFAAAGATLILTALIAPAALAIVAGPFYHPIEEVPIERLLENLKRHPRAGLEAFARIHLLAYIRQTKTLPAETRSEPGEETFSEGPFADCTPIARPKGGSEPVPKCHTEDTQFGFPAPRGLPEGSLAVRYPPDDHLKEARAAYERVVLMTPLRVRPRLALAYVYDRYGEMDKAIAQLRFIIEQADKELTGESHQYNDSKEGRDGYWDYQIVAAEAIEHLSLISKAAEDRARVAKLSPKLKAPEKVTLFITPILVPLTDNAALTSLVDPKARVRFDFTGQGLPLEGGWITKDAAWLVWDPGNKQHVTSGFQLFGSVTWLTPWRNGYLALGALDDDGNGKLEGVELRGLSLWRDANANGISDPGEVRPLADWHIVALDCHHRRKGKNAWVAEHGVTFANGKTHPTYDWNIAAQLVTANAK